MAANSQRHRNGHRQLAGIGHEMSECDSSTRELRQRSGGDDRFSSCIGQSYDVRTGTNISHRKHL